MLLKVQIVLTLGRRSEDWRQVQGKSLLVSGNVLFSDLDADYMDVPFVKNPAICVLMCNFPYVFMVK